MDVPRGAAHISPVLLPPCRGMSVSGGCLVYRDLRAKDSKDLWYLIQIFDFSFMFVKNCVFCSCSKTMFPGSLQSFPLTREQMVLIESHSLQDCVLAAE